MNIISIYRKAIGLLLKHWKMWLLIYGVNLSFGLLITLPFNAFFKNGLLYSMSPAESLKRFDYTFIMDFLNLYGFSFSSMLNSSYFILIPFFLLNVFLMAAMTAVYVNQNDQISSKTFFSGGVEYFWRFLRLSIYFLLIHLLVLFIFFKIFSLGGLSPFEIESDTVLINRFKWIGLGYLIILSLIFMIQDYAKVFVVKEDKIIITQSFIKVLPFVGKYFLQTFTLFFMTGVIFVLILGLYVFIRKSFFTSSESTLLLALVLGQAFILLRIGIKLLRISTAAKLVAQKEFNKV